jgi:hypothetical protein
MIILVIYNVIVLPMNIGLGMDPGPIFGTFHILIDIFFACDILLNFFTGYINKDNRLIMTQKKIIKNYMKLWF